MSVDDISKDDRDNLANSHNSAADVAQHVILRAGLVLPRRR